ncbi:MAG: hypothetical protein Satyrvirus9_5 [Satyrvirus sp.]|uniref:Bifunctional polynucleotide phosphatase/kinase n=1 Tax=Satyrvirus sp. TaxID=2487771 RepID=A0A3G5AIN7_9VIRU|nr:MAG: hypothetical protein Satyrvirus9_5 [Satyrvirus sp.]
MNWSETNSYLKGIINNLDSLTDPIRIASFDLDDTIIHRPKKNISGEKWKLLDISIIDKISNLAENKYLIIIFSNQSGMGTGKNFDKVKWRKAMDDLSKILVSKISSNKYYFAVYVSKDYDLYRKPNIGLWQLLKSDLKEEFNYDPKIKLRISDKSFFVGDAAGRKSASIFKKKLYPSSSKGDFSDTDRKFAINIGITFLTPEEYFMEDAPKMDFELTGFNPKKFISDLKKNPKIDSYQFKPRKKELIMLVGFPGTGKTEFYNKYMKPYGYVHINQDICKTKNKCMEMAEKALEKGELVVVDNTNPDVLTRMAYTTLAKKNGYKHIRAIIIGTGLEIAKHLNNVRHVYSGGIIPKINDITYNIFKKNFVKPQETEHFDKIETIDFNFDMDGLKDPVWKKIFMRLTES